ncbi:MAG: outer membrane beta-barrel protein [Chitinophagales bacterium]
MKREFYKSDLKSAMNDHLSAVDADEIWGNIEADVEALNATNRRKAGFLYFLLIGALAGTTLYFILNKNNPTTIVQDETSSLSWSEPTAFEANNDRVADNDHNVDFNSNITTNSVVTDKTTPFVAESSKPKSKNKYSPVDRQELQIKNSNAIKEPSKNQNFVNTSNEFLSNSTEESIPLTVNNPIGVANSDVKKDDNKFLTSAQWTAYSLNSIKSLNDSRSLALPPSNEQPKALKELKLKEDQSSKKTFEYSLGLHYGVSKPIKVLVKDAGDAELYAFRKQSETPIIESYYGIEFRAKHSSGMELMTGFSKHSILERFQYEFTHEEQEVVSETIDIDGDSYTLQQVTTTHRSIINKKYYNRQHYIQIPVMIGYKFDKGRWGIGIRSGLYGSYLYGDAGKIADITGEDINLNSEEDYRINSKFGAGVIMGVSMDVDVSKHLVLTVAPNFKYTITDQSSVEGISQRYWLMGGQIGLSYTFGK